MPRANIETQIHIQDWMNSAWFMRVCMWQPPDVEELLVMATGWRPLVVNLLAPDGTYLTRTRLPLTWFTLYPTDCETGFVRFSTAHIPDNRFTSFLLTARRAS